MTDKRPALGRGLGALIGETLDTAVPAAGAPFEVDINRLTPNRYQPRDHADEAGLNDLAASIKASGVIQPIVVRRAGGDFQIIAGERRWRAARMAGLTSVPVSVREIAEGDQKLLIMALVENIQREDLNPIASGKAYRQLAEEFHLTQDQIAQAVGKDRATIANCIRLLKLPAKVQEDVTSGRIAMGHARALLALETELAQRNMAREVVAKSLSVRETEQLVTKALAKNDEAKKKDGPTLDPDTRAAQEKMRMALGTKVDIVRRGKGGVVRISFKNEDELERIYEYLTERE